MMTESGEGYPQAGKMKLANKILTLGAMRLIMTVFIFSGDLVVSRYLGVALKGDYFFLVTNILLLGNILTGGLHFANIFYSKVIPLPELVGNSLVYFLAVTVIVYVLGLPLTSYMPTLSQGNFFLKIIFLTCLLGECAWIISANYFVLLDQLTHYAQIPVIRRGSFVLFAIFVWFTWLPSLDLMLGLYLLTTVIALFVIGLRLARQSRTVHCRWSSFRKCWGYGWRSHLFTLANEFTVRLNTILLGFWASSVAIGLFSVALNFAQFFLVVAASLMTIIQSGVSYPLEQQLSHLEKLCRHTIIIMALGAVALALVAQPLIRWGYGPAFAGAHPLLATLLPGMVCYSLFLMVSGFMVTNGRAFTAFSCGFTGLLVNGLLSLYLIPVKGALGAVWALNGGALASTMFLLIMFSVMFKVPLHCLLIIKKNDLIEITSKVKKIYSTSICKANNA